MLDLARWTFPDGTVFEAESITNYQSRVQDIFPISGTENLTSLFKQYVDGGGQPAGQADSYKQGLYLSLGAGIHEITVDIEQYQGATDTWGDTDPNDAPITKLQAWERARTTTTIDARNLCLFAHGEYSSSGQYDPIPVVIMEDTLDTRYEEESTLLSGSIRMHEVLDATDYVDAAARRGI